MTQALLDIDLQLLIDPKRIRITDLLPHASQHCTHCNQDTDHILAARLWRCGECGRASDQPT